MPDIKYLDRNLKPTIDIKIRDSIILINTDLQHSNCISKCNPIKQSADEFSSDDEDDEDEIFDESDPDSDEDHELTDESSDSLVINKPINKSITKGRICIGGINIEFTSSGCIGKRSDVFCETPESSKLWKTVGIPEDTDKISNIITLRNRTGISLYQHKGSDYNTFISMFNQLKIKYKCDTSRKCYCPIHIITRNCISSKDKIANLIKLMNL
jgi:hypothetical protein